MRSDAATVKEYLAELPDDRRNDLSVVRDAIVANLAPGFEEEMNFGMITYTVPLATYPDTYNGQPLLYAALANQKNHMAVYLTAVYAAEDTKERFVERYKETGKRLDMGKSCVRFRRLDDLPVDVIADTIASMDCQTFIQTYERARSHR